MNFEQRIAKRIVWEKPPKPHHVGLALGGGVARGIAHVGVLEILVEHEIPIDCIAGTSAGALVGGLFAAGQSPADLCKITRDLKWTTFSALSLPSVNLAAYNFSLVSLPLGLLDLDRMIAFIDRLTGRTVEFSDLHTPFAAVATDIATGEMVVMNDGPIAPAIRASCSVPGIFTPCRRKERLLVDGGAINNLPVTVVQQMGAEYVISVDLLPVSGEVQAAPTNVVDLSMTALYSLIRATQSDGPMADCMILPDIGHIGLADLAAADELLAAGRAAAEGMIPQIKEDLGL